MDYLDPCYNLIEFSRAIEHFKSKLENRIFPQTLPIFYFKLQPLQQPDVLFLELRFEFN